MLPEAAYAVDSTGKVYDLLSSHTDEILAAGHGVIADAVYGTDAEREGIAAVAHLAGVPFHPIWLDAPLAILEQRVAARRNDVSDATVDVLHKQRAETTLPIGWFMVDAGGSPEDTLRRAYAVLAIDNQRMTVHARNDFG